MFINLCSSLAPAHDQLLSKENAEEAATDDEIGQRICDMVRFQQSLVQNKSHLLINKDHTRRFTFNFRICYFFELISM